MWIINMNNYYVLSLLLASSVAWAQTPAPDIYRKTCAYCHEPTINDGRIIAKSLGPDLRGRSLPAVYTEYMVRHGRGAMPSFTEAEIPASVLQGLGKWILQSTRSTAGGAP